MQKFEYSSVPLVPHALQEILNNWGDEGWELVQVIDQRQTLSTDFLPAFLVQALECSRGGACVGVSVRQIFLIPMVLRMHLAKSRADNFRLIPANSAARDVLRVRAQSKIARTRADFERFSAKY